MKPHKYLIWFLVLFVVMSSATPSSAKTYPSNGELNWKGINWEVRSGTGSPGNNYWNNEGAWIDDQNRMHLTITNKDGKWQCTDLKSENKYLYGTYTWKIVSPVFTYDKICVVGLFTYLTDKEEIDIEFSRWGYENGDQIDYSVQPYGISGNSKTYKVPAGIDGTNIINTLDWQPEYIRFTSKTAGGQVLSDFTYTNIGGIPRNPEYLMMNLWLFNGAPSDGKNIELIISDFSYNEDPADIPEVVPEKPEETSEPVENKIVENRKKYRDTKNIVHSYTRR